MDAFIVSAYVRNSLRSKKQNKKLEHAAFIVNSPSSTEKYNLTSDSNNSNNSSNSNNIKTTDKSDNSSTMVDNSDNSTVADNSDNYKTVDNSDNSASAINNTDYSSNITVNNIKVVSKGSKVISEMENDEQEQEEEEEYHNNNKASKISNITFILMLIINSYAAYLSWECNSNKGYPLVLKVVFSFFAFVFGSIYLLYYILFRFDECNQFKNRSLI